MVAEVFLLGVCEAWKRPIKTFSVSQYTLSELILFIVHFTLIFADSPSSSVKSEYVFHDEFSIDRFRVFFAQGLAPPVVDLVDDKNLVL